MFDKVFKVFRNRFKFSKEKALDLFAFIILLTAFIKFVTIIVPPLYDMIIQIDLMDALQKTLKSIFVMLVVWALLWTLSRFD